VVDASLGYFHLQITTTRKLAEAGLPAVALAEYDGDALFGSTLISWTFDLGEFAQRRFAGVDAVWLDIDGFNEARGRLGRGDQRLRQLLLHRHPDRAFPGNGNRLGRTIDRTQDPGRSPQP